MRRRELTATTHSPPAAFADLDQAIAALRAAGLRLSASRRLLLEALFAAEGPVSAELLAWLSGAGAARGDAASVYRNLEVFEQLGLVRHVHLGHGAGLYALAGAGEREYLVCERCGALRSVEPAALDQLREAVRREFEFEVRFSHFPLNGLCSQCAEKIRFGASQGMATGIDEGVQMRDHHDDDHERDRPHSHEHSHGDDTHSHPHRSPDHEHIEHDHEHSHGDQVHSHPHAHEQGLEQDHGHEHEPDPAIALAPEPRRQAGER